MTSYWIDTLVLKTEGNTYATLLHHPLLFGEIQCSAQEVARRISGAVVGEFAQKSTIPSTHHNPYLSHYIICLSFSSPPLHPCRFIRPLFPILILSFSFAFFIIRFFAAMSETGEIIVNMDNNDNMENPEAPANELPILHTKKFRIGSGNIIGKGVIQDSLLVLVLYLPWVVLSFIKQVVLRMLSLFL